MTAVVLPYRISTPGDLEIALIHETHGMLAGIISSFLYRVVGEPPHQNLSFHTAEAMSLFCIRVGEFLADARNNVNVDAAPRNLSVTAGLGWLVTRLAENSAANLARRLQVLEVWLDTVDPCRFWCPGVDTTLTFSVSRRQLWNIQANTQKHTFLKLQRITRQVAQWSDAAGRPVVGSEVLHVLDSFGEWLHGYCEYHATMLAELLGHLFHALNNVVAERWAANGRSNDSRAIQHPADASAFFRDLHASVLVLKTYPDARIASLTPQTSVHFQRIYNP